MGIAYKLPICALFLFMTLGLVNCLSGVHVRVPGVVLAGQGVDLVCLYDLQGDPLYTIKWYKGGREFYRYTPEEHPPIKVFPTNEITLGSIDKERSNSTQVAVRPTSTGMTGFYSCEVSADAPSFHTALISAIMRVVIVPKGRPKISEMRRRYFFGEVLHAKCTSPPSKPAVNITWSISGRKVSNGHVMNYISINPEDQEVATSKIEIRLTRSKFNEGRFRVRCTMTLYNVYQQMAEESTIIETIDLSGNEIFEDYN